jgi:cephalosporin hydroxylase
MGVEMATKKAKTETETTIAEINLEEIENFVFGMGSDSVGYFGGAFEGGAQIQQIPDEIAPCILAILESGKEIKTFLEVGSAAGGTTFLFNHYFKPLKIYIVDDNTHPKAHLRPYILADIPRVEIIGNSQSGNAVKTVAAEGVMFDIVIIDADHDYPGVKADVENYGQFVQPGGFLILHDSALEGWGVMRVVNELKAAIGLEFVAEYVSKKYNICGVALFRKALNEDK